jgi:hypothetical protein
VTNRSQPQIAPERPLDAFELALVALVRSAHANRQKRRTRFEVVEGGNDEAARQSG